MRRIQIVDLDGCIADDRWRRRYIQPDNPNIHDRYHNYHRLSIADGLVNTNEIVEPIIIVLTGRPVRYREQTLIWLRDANLHPLYLLMRNNNDHTKVVELKRRMVLGLLDWNSYSVQKEELVLAIDDREPVVEMYRELGLNAKVVQLGAENEERM